MPAQVLWPERESLLDLMKLRASIGDAAFASEKQNSPTNPDACEWRADLFDWPGFWFTDWPSELIVKTLSLDPSKGADSKRGDYSAYVRYGRNQNGAEFIEADLKRRDTSTMVADGVEHVRAFQPQAFAVEANQYQELLLPEFERAAHLSGVVLPIVPLVNTINKQVRIRQNGPYLSQKRMRFKAGSPGTMLLVQQLRDFPIASHDDGPDALEVARRVAMQLILGRQQKSSPSRLRV